MKIDAHQHFWLLTNPFTDWPTPDLHRIHRDFQPDDLTDHLIASGIEATVLVQAAPSVDETAYCLAIAERTPFVRGVVGWVDLTAGDCLAQLDRFARHPLFKGIRPMLQGIDVPHWILQPSFEPVFDALVAGGRTFDGLIQSHQIADLIALGQRHPGLKMVLDHAGKPDIASGETQAWADDVRRLAAETDCLCKLSGLWTEAGNDTSIARIQPYVDHILDCFGSERVMWGSDWPVVELAGDYGDWLHQCEIMLESWPATDRAAIFGGNAARFYGLCDA